MNKKEMQYNTKQYTSHRKKILNPEWKADVTMKWNYSLWSLLKLILIIEDKTETISSKQHLSWFLTKG